MTIRHVLQHCGSVKDQLCLQAKKKATIRRYMLKSVNAVMQETNNVKRKRRLF